MQASPIRILLVEDDPGDVALTQEALNASKLSIALQVVEDGVEAMEFLRQSSRINGFSMPDLILLDLNLPRKDGREVLCDLKSDPELKLIPVVVLTTSKAEEDVLKSYDLGANCYIPKPVGMDQFIHIVQTIEDFWFTIVKLPKKMEQ